MRYPLRLTTALLVVCAGAGQANEALNPAQAQAAQLQAAQMQAAQMQYQSQAYMAAAQQQAQMAGQMPVQMPAMAGFAGADALPQGAGDAAQTAQYFMPSTYAGYGGYNPYAYMYGGYGTMGYYPYYGGMNQQPIIIQAPAKEEPKKEEVKVIEKIIEKPAEEPKPVAQPLPQPQPVPTREIIRVQTKTVPERIVPYIGVSGDIALWAPFNHRYLNATPTTSFTGNDEFDSFGYGGQAVVGFGCCRASAGSSAKMRVEGEVGYHRFLSDKFSATDMTTLTTTNNLDGSMEIWTGAANVYVDYQVGNVAPYVGGGLGAALGMFEVDSPAGLNVDTKDKTYLAQLMAGVNVDVSNNLALNVGYRFRNFGEFKDLDDGDLDFGDLELGQVHSFEAGIRIKF